MKKTLQTFLITKQVQAKDMKDALKREPEARIIGIVQKVAPSPEQLEPAIGFAVESQKDDE